MKKVGNEEDDEKDGEGKSQGGEISLQRGSSMKSGSHGDRIAEGRYEKE